MFVPAGRIVRVMLLHTKTVSLTIVLFACCGVALGQKNPPTILQIDFENNVQYNQDVFDVSKLATNPGVTTVAAAKNFMSNVVIADIVAVNGQPTKGEVKFQMPPGTARGIATVQVTSAWILGTSVRVPVN